MSKVMTPYDVRDVVKVMREWGFVPRPDRNVGGHVAYQLGTDGPIVGLSTGGRRSKNNTNYKRLKRLVDVTGAGSIEAFMRGPSKTRTVDPDEPSSTTTEAPADVETTTVLEDNVNSTTEQETYPTATAAAAAVPTPERRRPGSLRDEVATAILACENKAPVGEVLRLVGGSKGSVTATLSNMKTAGLVTNPERGFWSVVDPSRFEPKDDPAEQQELEVETSEPTQAEEMAANVVIPDNAHQPEETTPDPAEQALLGTSGGMTQALRKAQEEHAAGTPRSVKQVAAPRVPQGRFSDRDRQVLEHLSDRFHFVGFTSTGVPFVEDKATGAVGILGVVPLS